MFGFACYKTEICNWFREETALGLLEAFPSRQFLQRTGACKILERQIVRKNKLEVEEKKSKNKLKKILKHSVNIKHKKSNI